MESFEIESSEIESFRWKALRWKALRWKEISEGFGKEIRKKHLLFFLSGAFHVQANETIPMPEESQSSLLLLLLEVFGAGE